MIHVVAMKCLIGLPYEYILSFYEGVRVGVGGLKIEESESDWEVLCADCTALISVRKISGVSVNRKDSQLASLSQRPTKNI
jgi:hypothetical protein